MHGKLYLLRAGGLYSKDLRFDFAPMKPFLEYSQERRFDDTTSAIEPRLDD
jgi:hypothetical protein